MKFNTAVCFILAGIALYLIDAPAISRRSKTVAFICAWIVLIAGLLNLSEYIFNWNIGIDELLWKEGPETADTVFPGRMSLFTSINFTLLGFTFLILDKRKYHWPVTETLFIVIMPPSLLTILNYLFGNSFLNHIPLLATTALHTAILFIVLCIAVFFSSPLQYMRVSFKKKIATVFVLVSLMLGLTFWAIKITSGLTAETTHRVKQIHDILFLTEQIDARIYEMQSGANGYIISGKENYLPLFINAADTVNNIIRHLRTMTKDNVRQQLRIDSLEKNIDGYITSMKELIKIRRHQGFEAAQKIMLNSHEKLMPGKAGSLHIAIEQEENQLLVKRQVENEQSIQNSSRIITFLGITVVLLLLSALIAVYNNIKQRNKTEKALQKSVKETSEYKYALDESSIVAITDQKGIIKQVNDNFCKISKYKREELIGKDHRIINSGFHPKEFFRDMWETIARGKIWRAEVKNKAKDGTYYWMDTTIIPFLNEQGKPWQYVAIRSDITQRKELENEIRQFNLDLEKRVEEKAREVIEKEQQYRFLLQNMREGIQVIGYDWRYLFINNSVVEQAKYSHEELLGHTMMEKYPGIENSELFNILQRCMKERIPQVLENEFIFPDGTKGCFELSIQPVPEGLFILSTDITGRKIAEEAVSRERNLSGSIINSLPGIFYLFDETGKFLHWNKNFETVSGYSAAEINNLHPLDLFDADAKQLVGEKIAKVFTNGMAEVEAPFFTKTKEKIPYYFTGWQLTYESKTCLIGVGIDITERKKAEKLLVDSQQRYKNLLDNMNDGFIVDDISGKIIFANKKFLEIYGFTEEDIHDLVIEDYFAPEYHETLRDRHNRRLAGEHVSDVFEYEGLRKDGKRIWLGVRVNPIIENGRITGTQSIVRDITESKKAENALRESEETFRRLFNESADPVLLLDGTGFTDCNQSAVSILGNSYKEEIINKKPWDISPEKQPDGRLSAEKAEAMIAKALQQGYNRFEWVHTKSDGTEFPVEVMLTPIILNGKQSFYTLWRDIAERKKAQEEILKYNERFELIATTTQDGIWEWNLETGELWANEMHQRFYGLTLTDPVPTHEMWIQRIHPDDRDAILNGYEKTLNSERNIWTAEYRFRTTGEDYIIIYGRSYIIRNASGKPVRLMGSMIDITERKKAEEALAESENHLRTIVQAEPECVKLLGKDGELLNMNPAGLVMIEADNLQQVKGKSVLGIIDKPYRKAFEKLTQNVFEGKSEKMEFEITGLKGARRWLETHAVPLKNTEGKIIFLLGVTRDITERKKAEDKLRESNERYQFVNKATQDTIWEWDFLTKEGLWGEGIINTFGYSANMLKYGKAWIDEYVHPYDKEQVRRRIQTCIESGIENWQDEYRFRCADGTYKFVYDRGFILFDEQGKPYRMIGAMTDVTEQKRLEKELAEQRVRQQKLITETTILAQEKERNELGRELHDNINQILATIKMYLGMAKSGHNAPEDFLGKSYEHVNEAIEEIRKLSHSLVAPSLGDIGLKEALQELVEDASLLNDRQVQLLIDEKYYENDIDKNKELMFYRIVQEQLNNITKHAQANKVVISLKADNGNIALSVADNGVGFDSTQKSKGIGLKNISNRVEFYSGIMNIISSPGKGCTLEVFIPV